MNLKWRVAELAEQRGMSARQLAVAARLDEKTVRHILAGRATRVDLDTIAKLAEALHVVPGTLWAVDRSCAWERTAGTLGTMSPAELDRVMRGEWDDVPDPGLERATRDDVVAR